MAADAEVAMPDVQLRIARAVPEGEARVTLIAEERDANSLAKELFVHPSKRLE